MKHSLGFLFNVHCCVILVSVSRLIFLSLYVSNYRYFYLHVAQNDNMIISVNMWLLIYPYDTLISY